MQKPSPPVSPLVSPLAFQAASALVSPERARSVEVVVIGASAGGVDALFRILSGLPPDHPLPIVAVLHIPDDRESRLVEVLQRRVALRVTEARDKEPLAPSTVYCPPAGYHLSIEADRSFSLSNEDRVNHSRPSIDVLMDSAADVYGPRVAGFLLTGASADGSAGLARIRRRGGLTVVQDPNEAQAPAMPLAAIAQGAHEFVLPLDGIRALLSTLGRKGA